MSNRIRKALRGGGKISITIEHDHRGTIRYCVDESALRLTGIKRGEITREELEAAADPDALIQDVVSAAVRENHIAWEAHKE